ncbi:efflux RND transporter periplasmic adaptor subunit [Mariniblastus fucicola]|uniref:Multidrug resistance protein MdtN n=1 Tax=Mariniblastus fucicola TaxID=980251 RepID=A0A5B9PA03_9BACT|nr:HlyD family efflux transporter periplasmic adaptor subunit [Mariniblastus fucicola]QEG21740.1 multidrug resistance protein MdtN [Mariniblastus fucicola]
MSEEHNNPEKTADESAPASETAAPAPSPDATVRRRAKSDSLPSLMRYGLSLLILLGAAAGCYGLILLAKPTESQDPTALVPQVVLQKVDQYAGGIDLLVSGTVVPHREINVAAEVNGRVLKKYPECLAGNFVKKGTPLIQIDPEGYELELATIRAELVQADRRLDEIDRQISGERRNLQIAEQDYTIQNREYDRSKRLGSAISPSELDQARSSVNAAQAQVTARTNAIESLIASRETQVAAKSFTQQRLNRAELELRRTKIVAPADGVIVAESVQQDAFVRQGELVVQFENTEVSEVRCNLTTTDLDWIRMNSKDKEAAQSIYQLPRTEVQIYDASEPDVVWSGVLERFSGIGRDPVTKTTPCRIIVSKPVIQAKTGPRALVRGMYVKCRIEVQTSSADLGNDLLTFSERALQPNGDVWFVRGNSLMRSSVEVVDRSEWENDETGKMEVNIVARVKEGDLKPGDAVVVSPLAQPTVGAEVLIADGSEDASGEAANLKDSDSEEVAATKGDDAEQTN